LGIDDVPPAAASVVQALRPVYAPLKAVTPSCTAALFPEFNEMVRNELRGEVLEGLGEQRAVLPYHFVMIGIAPTVGFFYFGVPWFRQTSLISQFAFGAYMLTFLVAGMPLVVAHGAWRGSQLRPLEQTRVVAAVKQHWLSYLRIALEGATGFILVWTSIAFVAPLAVANAPGLYLGLREGGALWLAVLANAPVWLMALWTYRGGSSDWERTLLKFFVAKRKRKSTQVVAPEPLEQTRKRSPQCKSNQSQSP
jgi:hypothetical protein